MADRLAQARRVRRSRWIKEEHDCDRPDIGRRGPGSIWQCWCGKKWKVVRYSGVNWWKAEA